MKKNTWFDYLGYAMIAVLFSAVLVSFFIVRTPTRYELREPHQVITTQGLSLLWQRDGISTAGFGEDGSYMLVKNGKVFFQGTVKSGNPTVISVLNANDGSYIANSRALPNGAQFTTDGTSLYIVGTRDGKTVITKYDETLQKQIWSTDLGSMIYDHPCCLNIVDGELQASWVYKNTDLFCQLSLEDGHFTTKLDKEKVYRQENGIYYQNDGGVITASDRDGITIWRLPRDIKPPQQQPVFRNGILFFNSEGSPAGVVYAVDQLNGKILWYTNFRAVGNVAASNGRLYMLREDGALLGLNQVSGSLETYAQLSSIVGIHDKKTNPNYQVAYEDETGTVFLLTEDSGQLFAFRETQ